MYKTLWCSCCLRMTTHGQYEPKGLWFCVNELDHRPRPPKEPEPDRRTDDATTGLHK